MNTLTRIGAYAGALVLAFAGALGVGATVGPVGGVARSLQGDPSSGQHNSSEHVGQPPASAGGVPGGLAVSANGYTLSPVQSVLPRGQSTTFRFVITGPDGEPVTRYTAQHDKDLHLILVRRDLSGFQHLHPVLGSDGVWSQRLSVPTAGDYRVFADFLPNAENSRPLTLGADLHVAGDYSPQPVPAPSRTATVDGYTVTLTGELLAGKSSPLALEVSKDGRPVTDLQPYLAAYGHLVALRAGDLAYLHVHPEGHPGDGSTRPGPDVQFAAEVPTAGTYRLYLDFRHAGVVRTAQFTAVATPPGHAPR